MTPITYVLRAKTPKKNDRFIPDAEFIEGITHLGCQVGYAKEFECDPSNPRGYSPTNFPQLIVKVPREQEEPFKYFVNKSRHRIWIEEDGRDIGLIRLEQRQKERTSEGQTST